MSAPAAGRSGGLTRGGQPAARTPAGPSPAFQPAPTGSFKQVPEGGTWGLGLTARTPALLIPARLETRFGTGNELLVRIYPDQFSVDAHEVGLTDAEKAAGEAYWQEVWRAGSQAPDPEELKGAWRMIAKLFGTPRAAWIVLRTTPTNPTDQPATRVPDGQAPPKPPVFPSPAGRTSSWTQPPTAVGLPDFWVAVTYAGGVPSAPTYSTPVQEPVAVGLDPNAGPPPEDIPVDEGMRWMVDFAAAEANGMALHVPISASQRSQGVDTLIVFGLRSDSPESGDQVLADLLNDHHYSDGLRWIVQGAPTNNTDIAPSAFSRSDPNFDRSFAVERQADLGADPDCDAQVAAHLLGLPAETFAHIAESNRFDQKDAEQMAIAVWPGTIGYFAENQMASVFTRDQVDQARSYFVSQVRARGPLPGLAVGKVPYGILPATSIALWNSELATGPIESPLVEFLKRAMPTWVKSVASAPHIGGGDPDEELTSILGMDASSMTFRSRWAIGGVFMWNFLDWLGFDLGAQTDWWKQFISPVRLLLDRLGYTTWNPHLAEVGMAPDSSPITYPTVQAGPLSETDLLKDDATLGDGSKVNYIRWLHDATYDQLQADAYPGPYPDTLLYRVLRQSLLTEYFRQASGVQVTEGTLSADDTIEPELVHVGSFHSVSRWEVLARPSSSEPRLSWGEHLNSATRISGHDYPGLRELLASLEWLAGLPSAELDRLLTETLDVCSHRLDAYMTSIATSALRLARAPTTGDSPTEGQPASLHLGAFSWVEGIKPEGSVSAVTGTEMASVARLQKARVEVAPSLSAVAVRQPRSENGGYIYAPSIAQATAAAILRLGYLTHRMTPNGQSLAIDLSSKRVRNALIIFDGIRRGQQLEALLGYRFEEGLLAGGLMGYQQHFRDRFPIVNTQLTPANPGETVAATDVVDGYALQQAWKNKQLVPGGTWGDGLPGPGNGQNAVVLLLQDLDDVMDAISDVSMAEAVFQIVGGNPGRAGGILDAVSRGQRPPEPQVIRTPRGGLDLTHRVMLLMADDPAWGSGWSGVGAHPRLGCETRLSRWVSQLLPDATNVRCYVAYKDSGGAARRTPVTLRDLDLGPLDYLAIATANAVPAEGEIEQRVRYFAVPSGATDATVVFDLDPVTDAGLISFPDVGFAAGEIRELLGNARPLGPADLIDPDHDPNTLGGIVDLADINTRAQDAVTKLNSAQAALSAAATPAASRTALIAASYFGVQGAVPQSIDEDGSALSSRVKSVLDELGRRQAAAATPALPAARPEDAVAVIKAVFGKSALVLPLFTPPDIGNLRLALADSDLLVGTDRLAKDRWFQQLTYVRTGIARLDAALVVSELLRQVSRPQLTLGQLPYVANDRWLGLDLPPQLPSPGRLAIAAILAGDYMTKTSFAGVLLDEWPERIPSAQQQAGLSFHYEEPHARAPQALLLALCPDKRLVWDDQLLESIINESLGLAKIRAVDLDSLADGGQILPALYFPFNPKKDTFTADLAAIQQRGVTGAISN